MLAQNFPNVGPPSSKASNDTYARLYYVVIRRRTYHFCAISYLISTFVLWFVMLDGLPAVWNGLRITTWIMAGAIWASATIPIMTLRRSLLTASRLYASTRYGKVIAVLASAQFVTSSFVCAVSAFLLWATYVSTAMALNEQPELNLFKIIPGRGPSQLNERPIYLGASCFYTALCYSFWVSYQGRWRYRPSDDSEHLAIPQRIWKSISTRVQVARRLIGYSSASFLPLYLISRRFVIRATIFSKYVQITKYIKPHLVMLIKFDSVFTLTATFRLVMLNTMMVTMWEIVQSLWDVYSTHPFDISRFHVEPNRCLLEGIRSPESRIQHHAVYELAHLSWSDPARRATIFQDIRTSPRILNMIIDECLSIIDATKSTGECRGENVHQGLVNSNQAPPRASKPVSGAHSALKNDLPQLFNHPPPASNSLKQTLLTKLLTTNESDPAANSTQPTIAVSSVSTNQYQIPEIFRSQRRRQSPENNFAPVSSASSAAVSTQPTRSANVASAPKGPKREKSVPKVWQVLLNSRPFLFSDFGPQLETWLFSPLITAELEKCLGNRQTCTLAVEAVTNLTCASLTEDQYGIVQSQIPRILNTLVDCCDVLEDLRADLCYEFGLEPNPIDAREPQQAKLHQALDEYMHPLLTRLKDGIAGILDQFKPFLKEMSINSRVEKWIQKHTR